MEPQYHPSQEKILRGKKARHRRSGSHGSSSLTPRDSPNRDRRSVSHGEDRVLGRLCEQETQTELPPSYPYFAPHGCEVPMSGSDVENSPRAAFCSRSIAESLHTPRYSASTASLNGNSVLDPAATPGSSCECPGCPGNPGTFPPLLLEQDMENRNLDQEDYLDTLDRKVNEIMNRDCSRRSSYHDLGKGKDGRKRTLSDLNSNPSPYSPRLGPPAPEGAIRFEDDGKASSSEAIDSSREDLSHAWSEEEDSDHYVLRRRSLARRPIQSKNRASVMSIRSAETVTSGEEEGEATEYPASSSQRSTLESRPEMLTNGIKGVELRSLDVTVDTDDDDLSQVGNVFNYVTMSYLRNRHRRICFAVQYTCVCLISVCSGDNCHSSREGWGLVELVPLPLVWHQQPVQQPALQWQLLFTSGSSCDESSNDISSNSALPHPRSCFTVYPLRSRICDVRKVFLGGNTSVKCSLEATLARIQSGNYLAIASQ